MDDLERRVILLEVQQHFDRQLTQLHLTGLHHRLQPLERGQLLPSISPGSIFKLVFAFLLPFLVLLVTGDLAKAVLTVRMVLGG